ncbi:MAG TPA: segregation/condensation protein A [Terriglobia bacterium]|jgi:segregation and condensation protein A|nr:segregation/condensation protein A [Terriglobia bacterium]
MPEQDNTIPSQAATDAGAASTEPSSAGASGAQADASPVSTTADTSPVSTMDVSTAAPAADLPARRATRALTPPPPVKLEAYEGPLDLLLDLIRKQQLNIYDIPIARITQQYLDYLRVCDELNIDLGGEFVFMAATLIYIKSRTLLPPDPNAAEEDLDDPRAELVHRLLEHEQFKNAAQMLQSKRVVEEAMWSQPGIGEFAEAEDEPGLAVSVFDLISSFREILERARKRPPMAIQREEVTVGEMIEHVRDVLRNRRGPVLLDDLAEGFLSRQALVALLLALLELVRLRAILLRQKELFAPISLQRSKYFDEVMAGANRTTLEAALEESFGENDEQRLMNDEQ